MEASNEPRNATPPADGATPSPYPPEHEAPAVASADPSPAGETSTSTAESPSASGSSETGSPASSPTSTPEAAPPTATATAAAPDGTSGNDGAPSEPRTDYDGAILDGDDGYESAPDAASRISTSPLRAALPSAGSKITVQADGMLTLSEPGHGTYPVHVPEHPLAELRPGTEIHVTDEGVHAIVPRAQADSTTHPKHRGFDTHTIVADVEQGLRAFVDQIKAEVQAAETKVREIL